MRNFKIFLFTKRIQSKWDEWGHDAYIVDESKEILIEF
jgi:hypothetical protein